VNAWRAPGGILRNHSENEGPAGGPP
jgi:hypothetical protein